MELVSTPRVRARVRFPSGAAKRADLAVDAEFELETIWPDGHVEWWASGTCEFIDLERVGAADAVPAFLDALARSQIEDLYLELGIAGAAPDRSSDRVAIEWAIPDSLAAAFAARGS
jgi:hypothetical protein